MRYIITIENCTVHPPTGMFIWEVVAIGPGGDYTASLHTSEEAAQAAANELTAMLGIIAPLEHRPYNDGNAADAE